ncbi:MAG: GNAT family N-acetyltransferase [Anaeroplasmataceae bacterium]|nr:GNAT family N-acetyltransferase [Anaeroplasmataceae bacterium]
MRIIGKQILIRDLKFADEEDYYLYGKDEHVGPNAGWKPFPNITVARRVLSGQMMSKETYAIALKESNQLIGTISLYNSGIRKYNKVKSLGFSLNYNYWNQGFMTEAVQLMMEYAFTKTDCEILEVGHHMDNFGCKRVIEKCGFTFDGVLCSYKKLYDGRLVDACFYSMKKEEYERKIERE